MKILHVFIMLIVITSCYSHMRNVEKKERRITPQKRNSREIETYTEMILGNESYSILPIAMHPKNPPNSTPRKEEANSSKMKLSNETRSHRLKSTHYMQHSRIKVTPNITLSLAKNSRPSRKHIEKKPSHNFQNKDYRPKKAVRKRHFERNYPISLPPNPLASNASFLLTPFPNPLRYNLVTNEALNAPRPSIHKIPTSASYNSPQSFNENSWRKSDLLQPMTNARGPSFLNILPPRPPEFKPLNPDSFQNPYVTQRYETGMQGSGVMRTYRENARSVGELVSSTAMATVTNTAPPMHSMLFHQADIIARNLPISGQQPIIDKGEKENSRIDESDPDDTKINFKGACEWIINETCWMQRQVGDVLTLAIKIDSVKKQESFQVRWMKVYHVYDSKKGRPLEIEPGKLPWNMVSGSEGRELRLNPVTNSDLDPNCFVAKVFMLSEHRGKTLYILLKKMTFRIDIPITDMGMVYAGEELNINIENFISLPERGNLLFDWNLETEPHQYVSLPSNIKVSYSGRSVVLKELKNGRMGVLNCVIYSSNKFAVAKRRFNILKIAESVKRRSTVTSVNSATSNLKRSQQCRHIIRRSQERAMQWLKEENKPKSRQKRFKRTRAGAEGITEKDCEHLKRKIYSRWVRSLLDDLTTQDSKLMPLKKLFELSEEGDGTLDDVIPREIHYVRPEVRVLPGTSNERSIGHLYHSSNCTTNDDCGENAVCVSHQIDTSSTVVNNGYCNCLPDFYGDGFACQRIPESNHREKRLRRNANRNFEVPQHLFYERLSKDTPPSLTTAGIAEDEEDTRPVTKVLAFEEEESFLLSDCIDDKDCSTHASCIQPTNGHPYCKCRPGFRGNGIFCWETVDYVPPEENILAGDEIAPTYFPEDRLMSRLPSSDEVVDQ